MAQQVKEVPPKPKDLSTLRNSGERKNHLPKVSSTQNNHSLTHTQPPLLSLPHIHTFTPPTYTPTCPYTHTHAYVNANIYLGVTAQAFNPSSQEAEAGPY